jgi:hypothetical protein
MRGASKESKDGIDDFEGDEKRAFTERRHDANNEGGDEDQGIEDTWPSKSSIPWPWRPASRWEKFVTRLSFSKQKTSWLKKARNR